MFEHLDDPAPPQPDGALRRAVGQRAARRQRQRRVGAGAAGGLLAIAATATAFGLTSAGGHQSLKVASRPPTTGALPDTIAPSTVVTPSTTVAPTSTTPPGPPLVCGALTPPGATSGPQKATATMGTITVTLSGSASRAYGDPSLDGARLTVVDGTTTVVSASVAPPASPGTAMAAVIPWAIYGSDPFTSAQLCLARFATLQRPTVVLGLNLGGAHCCTIVRAYAPTPAGAAPLDEDLGNPPGQLQAVGGYTVIVTGDDSFNYTFASYAGSGVPLKVLDFQGAAFVDVTRRHLDLVGPDAARWWAAYQANPSDGLGLLAAWVGDECLLGRSSQAFATVDQLQAQGKLTSSSGGNWPTGAQYVASLHAFLQQHGYC